MAGPGNKVRGLFFVGTVVTLCPLAVAACAVQEGDPSLERTAQARAPISVLDAADAGCSTLSVKGLSLQIIAQSNCISPGAFLEIGAQPNVTMQDTVFPFLEEPARSALVAAVTEHPETTMTLNSALRTVAQQYLLYRWYQENRCSISLAATPGTSNHETGLALDISQYDTWRPILESKGFAWLGSSDPFHFDYAGAGAIDYRGTDVLAFQMLWNENHPDDPIDEDGAWGPQTEARMEASPAEGFAIGPSCADAPDVWLETELPVVFDRFADGASATTGVSAEDTPALQGPIRRIAFVPFEQGSGPAAIDNLQVDGAVMGEPAPTRGGGADNDEACTCRAAGLPARALGGYLALVASIALVRRRSQRADQTRDRSRRAA